MALFGYTLIRVTGILYTGRDGKGREVMNVYQWPYCHHWPTELELGFLFDLGLGSVWNYNRKRKRRNR